MQDVVMLGFKVLIAFIILLLYSCVQWKLFVATEKRINLKQKTKVAVCSQAQNPAFWRFCSERTA